MQADLAGREFEGERGGGAVIISAAEVVGNQVTEEERAAVLEKHADAMNIPRRPAWDRQTTPSQIQEQERASFLEWRRRLARCAAPQAECFLLSMDSARLVSATNILQRKHIYRLEEQEGVLLTPFEKNLEVWRQLWRVIERSDVIAQVVDARDPLFYRSADLESYARYASCRSTIS